MRWMLALLLVACKGGETPVPTEPTPDPTLEDADGDGVTPADGDCNDLNPAIVPGADDWVGDGIDQDCDGRDGVDRDGDGFTDALLGGDDCDDADDAVRPGAVEICNGIDDDCDRAVDDLDPDRVPSVTFYRDADGDGFGTDADTMLSCDVPPGYAADATDCDDSLVLVHPGADELCNDRDDDCDGDVDLDDADYVGPTPILYVDADLDGHGDPAAIAEVCSVRAGAALAGDDCDDTDPATWQVLDWYADADGDGRRGPLLGASCGAPVPEALRESALEDCNDADPLVYTEAGWWADTDHDGVGAGATVLACNAPVDHVRATGPEDCDDAADQVYPGAPDACDDGIDADCDGAPCRYRHCGDVLVADPLAPTGVYTIHTGPSGSARNLFCDMDTDGGGWTRVVHATVAPNDRAQGYSTSLGAGSPIASNGIFHELRADLPMSDLRVGCKALATDPDWTVDLVFYDNPWYAEITAGTDLESCFNEGDGVGYDTPAPARRNLLTDEVRGLGDDFDRGYLSGEATCDDGSFVVDFDDGGLGVSSDTRWGREGAVNACGLGTGEVFMMWVRPSTVSVDLDGDGHTAPGAGTGTEDDCDDGNPTVATGFPELCDGLDNDCDTLADAVDPDVVFVGSSVDVDSTWAAGTTTCSAGPVTVSSGVTVTVEAGALVDVDLVVDGALVATDGVDPVVLQGVTLTGGGLVSLDGVWAVGGDLTLPPLATLTNSQLDGTTLRLVGDQAGVTLTNNDLLDVFLDATLATSDLSATQNWWGTTDSSVIEGFIHDATDDALLACTVTFEPAWPGPGGSVP